MSMGPLMIDLIGKQLLPEERQLLKHPLIGGLILFTRNFESREQLIQLINEVRAESHPSLLIAADYEGGRVQRFRKDFTVLPAMRLLGQIYDRDQNQALELAHHLGWLLAAELGAVGIDLNFGPVVDLDYGASSVIGDRAFHRDPQAVAQLAISILSGMRAAGISAVAKHFPGHGAVVADSHIAMPVDHRPYSLLGEDILPYKRLITEGQLPAVMAAHVVFDQVDNLPASFSQQWLVNELRTHLGFSGAVFSDDLSMEGASVMGAMPARAERALAAGCDMVLICNNRPAVLQTLDELSVPPNPLREFRLTRLRRTPVLTQEQLINSDQWQQYRKNIYRYWDGTQFTV